MPSKTKLLSGFLTTVLVLLVPVHIAHPQQTPQALLDTEPPPMSLQTPETILTSFFKTESQVRDALKQYTFRRDVILQTIGPGGQVTGQYVRNSQFIFDDNGNRIERITYRPPSTIREMRITKEDIQDLASAQLLGIDILEAAKYQLTYGGQELLAGKRVYRLSVDPAVNPIRTA